ncbi:MAG: zinc ABC transporter substrate-binding protein [Acidimicrobiia bacterium]|nr:MAG: zinc ABC transporter substrate-binding protein [Acidimicrobiia bacterium]
MRGFPVLAVALVGLLAACGGDDGVSAPDARGRVEVVASFYPLAEVVRQVGGERVAVENLTAAGAEPHDLELAPGQVEDIVDADLVVVMGRDFQPAVEEVASRRDGATVVVLDELAARGVRGLAEVDEEDDAHVWLDPTIMQEIVRTVAESLSELDPEHATGYDAAARRHVGELALLDEELSAGLASCERREIVTAHEAFGWLARRYDLEQYAVSGIEPDQEPSADRIAELADLARAKGVTTIFAETLVSPEVAETLAREAGGLRVAVLDPLEGLTDAQIAAGDDYFTVMRRNLAALRAALGCDARGGA